MGIEEARVLKLEEGETPVAVRYRPRPNGNWVQIEPIEPTEADMKSKGGIIMPGLGPKRRREMAEPEDHTRFKMTHSRVLAVGPDVTRCKVGDVIRFVSHPQNPMTGECVQECIVNGEYINAIPDTLIYLTLEPVGQEARTLQ